MAEFSIIHLADLHIVNDEGKKFNINKEYQILNKLIEDIEIRTKNMQNIVIVVTGDIVDKSRFGDINDISKNSALQFFSKLFTIFKPDREGKPSRLIDVQICPGNHEKALYGSSGLDEIREFSEELQNYSFDRAKMNESQLLTDNNKRGYKKPGDTCHWEKIRPAFEGYILLTNKIYEIYNDICNGEKPLIDDSCGVEFKIIKSDIYNAKGTKEQQSDLVLSFIRLNTALISAGQPEEIERRRLLVGEAQRERLREIYKTQVDHIIETEDGIIKDDIVTFCLSHYPLDFLQHMDEDDIKKELLSESGLNAEFFFYGHTHEREIVSFSKKTQKVTCLETGIGAYTGDERDYDRSSYSIYTFNRAKNIYSVSMLKSDATGEKFVTDTGFMGEDTKRMVYPWLLKEQPFIRPEAHNDDSILRDFYVDYEVLNKLKDAAECQIVFKEQCRKILQKILLLSKVQKYLSKLNDAELSDEGNEKYPKGGLKSIISTSFENTPLLDNIVNKDIKHINKVIIKFLEKFISLDMQMKNDEPDSSIFFTEMDELYIDPDLNTHIGINEGSKKSGKLYEDYKSEDFYNFLDGIACAFLHSYGNVFKGDIVRVIIRAHDNEKRDGVYNDEPLPSHDGDVYRPIIIREKHEEQDNSNRHYDWMDEDDNLLITAMAYNEGKSAPRIYSLNKDLVNFDVKNWTDFIVITPKNLYYEISEPKKGNRPALSIIISVKLNVKNDRKPAELKKRFKQLSNKLYLLAHMDIQKTFDSLIKDFINVYGIKTEEFIKYINKKNLYKFPDVKSD